MLSGETDGAVRLWHIDWELEAVDAIDWDEGARSYLETFLTLHTPYISSLPQDREPREEEIQHALTRSGHPSWNDEHFSELLNSLSYAGYGWLSPGGVKKQLERMASQRRPEATALRIVLHGQEHVLSDERTSVSMGRDQSADLVIKDHMASRSHCKIERRLHKFILTDHSKNGTFVMIEGDREIVLWDWEFALRERLDRFRATENNRYRHP